MALEMEHVTYDRLIVFRGVYQAFLHTLPPSEQYYCPQISALRTDHSILSVLELDRSIVVTQAHFRAINENMQAHIEKANHRLKQRLRDAAGIDDDPWKRVRYVYRRVWRSSDGHPRRVSDCFLIGWDMIATHSYKGHSKEWLRPGVPVDAPREFELNTKSCGQVGILLALAGLPRETTVEMIDDRDFRFVCEPCDGNCKVFTWRAAVSPWLLHS